MKLLIFQLGSAQYAIETNHVHCIVKGGQEKFSYIDSDEQAIEGLIEMEGRTSAVINISAILPMRYSKESTSTKREERLLVYDLEDELVVFRIEGIKETIDVSSWDIEPIEPPQTYKNPSLFKGIVQQNEQNIPLLDPIQILQSIQ